MILFKPRVSKVIFAQTTGGLSVIIPFVKDFDNVNFSFVFREGNEVAHLLTRWAALLNWNGPIPISNLSPLVIQVLDEDDHRSNLDCIFLFCSK